MRPAARLRVCASVVLLQGCVYYNGMYNARHFEHQAEQSARAGRMNEANDRWRLALLHADSVISRHPRSSWVPEAYLVHGRAQLELESYADAVTALQVAINTLTSDNRRREAQLYLGRANLGMRRYEEALAALDSALLSSDARRASQARLYRGRALMGMRDPVRALEDFRSSRETDASVERAKAALSLGDLELAAAYADSMTIRAAFSEAQWLPLLDSLGRSRVAPRASGLVDRLALRADVGRGAYARIELAEGDRQMEKGDTSAAAARYRDVVRLVPDSAEGRLAELRLVKVELRAIATTQDLARVQAHLVRLVSVGGSAGAGARDLALLIALADTLETVPGPSDAYWFLRGELLRDSIGAAPLAAITFAEMASRFPESPWTPKGLVAAIALAHPAADSLRTLLATRYAASPYVATVLPVPDRPQQFAALEDSLAVALRGRPGAQRSVVPADPTRPPQRPTTRPSIDP